MKAHQLAVVLVKVFGLSVAVYGIEMLIAGFCSILWTNLARFSEIWSLRSDTLWGAVMNYGITGGVQLCLGLYLLRNAASIVDRYLKIGMEE